MQRMRFHEWRETVRRPVIIELGAGIAIPAVRMFGALLDAPLIRINPMDVEVEKPGDIPIQAGALAGIAAIARELAAMGFSDLAESS